MSNTWATVDDLATELQISKATVYRRVETGEWPAGRTGRAIRFSPQQQDEIREMIQRQDTPEYDWDRISNALDKLSA